LNAEDASSTHQITTTVTTHSGAWRLLAGALIAVMAMLMCTATITDNAWLLLSGPVIGVAAVLASQQADRELQRLFHAVAGHARSGAAESEPALAPFTSVDEQPTATGGR
ncbi:MAG: hypothetical protein L0H96_26260, partial [Humibacillus sp.]|nr:hypothetical protein [Humibacillus sp.]